MTFEQTLTIAIITAVTTMIANSILQAITKKLDMEFEGKKFKRNRAMERLDNLYFELYKGIIQSEYLRYFFNNYKLKELDFYNYPFLEIGKRSEKVTTDLFSGEVQSEKNEIIHDDITEEKKIYLANLIIKNSKYASEDLLKIAVAYRYVHSNYQKEHTDKKLQEHFWDEEIRLLRVMVMTIIKEHNHLTDLCGLQYNGKEWNYGHFDSKVFNKDSI